ncbi:MAG: response regulator [Chloroflexi bacterium]|nr:response regulator [Chloroflexota bacterium]MDA1218900.1 response regulator [Chloroflexota bacterium]
MNEASNMTDKSLAEGMGQIIDGIPIWVQVCDLEGRIQSVNHAAIKMSGYDSSEMVGQSWPYPWFSGQDAESAEPQEWAAGQWPIVELRRSGHISEFEAPCTTRDGKRRVLGVTFALLKNDSGQPAGVLMSAYDLTDRKVREADLGQALKMQAVSQLASGIAHDINNNLAVILGYSEFLLGTSGSFGEVVREALSAIQEQSIDCANTVRRIQLFSRKVPKTQFSSFSLNQLINELIQANGALCNDQRATPHVGIRVETDLADLPEIYAYEAGLKEALSSLAVNAAEALPNGGIVTFRTRASGDQIIIQVSDNGEGITLEVINRIFDAFFTTKGPASSGLGLSVAYNLVTQQGGKISVDSQEGKGTTFTIALAYQAAEPPIVPILQYSGIRESLSVLVIDDEPMVADVFRTFLEASGNRVVTCLTGSNALEVFKDHDFDLALIDVGMPNMDGWEVSRRINEMNPAFPIILATGWNVSVEEACEKGAQVRAVLRKPFGMQELSSAIGQAMA